MDLPESDWKLLRRVHGAGLERYADACFGTERVPRMTSTSPFSAFFKAAIVRSQRPLTTCAALGHSIGWSQ